MRRAAFFVAITAMALCACGPASTSSGSPAPSQSVADLAKVVSGAANGQTAHFTMRATGWQDTTSTGEIRFGDPAALSLDMRLPQLGDMKIILLGDTCYASMAMLRQQTGKQWSTMDLNGTDPASRQLAPFVAMADQNADPARELALIASAGTVQSRSPDTVDGSPATRYQLTVDLDKLVGSLSGNNSALRQTLVAAERSGVRTYPVTVWLNSRNLPVKTASDLRMTVNGRQIDSGQTVQYSDWGQPVTIQAPPADQVGPMPSS